MCAHGPIDPVVPVWWLHTNHGRAISCNLTGMSVLPRGVAQPINASRTESGTAAVPVSHTHASALGGDGGLGGLAWDDGLILWK